jgi:hypothetical protein
VKERVEVRTQAELEKVLAKGNIPICVGNGRFVLRGSSHAVLWGSSHAVLWGSSHAVLWDSSHAELWGSSHAVLRGSSHAVLRGSSHAELWGSSHAVLWDSSHAVLRGSSHAVLWDSSHAELRDSSHAELRDSSHAVLWDSSHAELRSPLVAVHKQINSWSKPKVTGKGVVIEVLPCKTPEEWCERYGLKVSRGAATLYKALDADLKATRNFAYPIGETVAAPDWDGGVAECGGGLHFSPSPAHALDFNREAKRFVACRVKLADIAVHEDATYPAKVKAKRCRVLYEVDRRGEKVA